MNFYPMRVHYGVFSLCFENESCSRRGGKQGVVLFLEENAKN